ncbi:T9SS type A sorting domain-containing protein [Hymenobacter sp. UYCo722]|uniref:T9SS type A sorting domain-containing protein n=1 Tax=Hymenobacter sp. UYCo722 TaxID=3156335 RepID=UPI00339407C6
MTATTFYNKVVIPLPSSTTVGTRVQIRIILTAGTKNANIILVDDVTLTSGNGTALPVSLTRFNATTQANSVALSWATASEKNSAYFDVQRSATGDTYETLGRVAAQGTSNSLREYAFTDARPLAGLAYYRLRQVDNDGTTAYSPIVTANRSTEVAIYPNPTTDAVTLPASLGPVRYRVLNTLGQMLTSGQATGGDRLDLSTLPKGSFFLELTDTAGRRTQRLTRE